MDTIQEANNSLSNAVVWATLVGPIIAVIISIIITALQNKYQKQKEKKRQVFETLVKTRGLVGDPSFGWAINAMMLYFPKDRKVIAAYSKFINLAKDYEGMTPSDESQILLNKAQDELFVEIAVALGHDRSTVERLPFYQSQANDHLQKAQMGALYSVCALPDIAKHMYDSSNTSKEILRMSIANSGILGPQASEEIIKSVRNNLYLTSRKTVPSD